MAHGTGCLCASTAGQQRRQFLLIADKQETRLGMAFCCNIKSLDDYVRRVIAPHGVYRKRVDRRHKATLPDTRA
jgi:hypothetical protein